MNHSCENDNCRSEVNEHMQNTLSDMKNTDNAQEDIPHIISRILSLAREIGCLSEYRVPVEDGSTSPAPQKGSR